MSGNREKILKAAVDAFAERGYDGTSTNQICAAAGVSKGLLFHYYRTKENLYAATVDHCLDTFFEAMQMEDFENCSDGLSALSGFNRCLSRYFMEHPNDFYVLTQFPGEHSEQLKEYVRKKREDFSSKLNLGLRLYLSRCALRPGVDREVVMEMLSAMLVSLHEKYMAAVRHREFPPEKLTQQLEKEFLAAVDIISYGILENRPQ